ncbi:MAG: LPS-assembly protein LptD [Yoonia sp.]|uniref:LPS-assembly protein LptD n=1 Tax=Yoonia sp. TaxID=2212373 RepID=UPI003EF77758
MRILALLLCLLPSITWAQGAATLVADRVTLNGEDQLIATGNVEVLYDGSRLTASAITYDRPSDTLDITGPIFLRDAEGTILTASSATLDPRLENGILQGARIVLDQQLQLVAAQIDQRDGRYSQLYKTSATSCRVCGTRPPLWSIRAERVIRDEQERQLYFENATFRIRDVPVFWLPRMRLPDPTLDRANGFLIPEQRNTNRLGAGLKLPYFITLGDHRDLTVTPYASAETRTLELRYRQAFVRGDIEINAAYSDDTLVDENRSYLFAEGAFRLPRGYQLAFDFETTSDPAYLLDYGYADKDRLDSAVSLLRVTDNTLQLARLSYFQTLRDNETNASLPPLIADLRYETRKTPGFGGTLDLTASLDTEYRPSEDDGDAGRDVTRGGAAVAWRDTWTTPQGIMAEVQAGTRADVYLIDDDSSYDRTSMRAVPDATVTLRWPLAATTESGTTYVLEPTLFAGWATLLGDDVPNEDSTRSELDRANLFAVSRFVGEDAVQTGTQAAAGLTWSRFGALGTTTTLAFGRVVRQEANPAFTQSSGLDGAQSDWLIATQFTAPNGFVFDARSLWADSRGPTVADSRVAWRNKTIAFSANYHRQDPDPAEGRNGDVSEWTVDAAFEINTAWTVEMDARYDVASDRPVRAGAGLKWRNECVSINVSVSRRFASSTTVAPTTTFGLSGSVGGFSTGRPAGRNAAACGN